MNRTEALLLFGISPLYTEEEFKTRWRQLVKQHHPDLGHDPNYFLRLKIAYDELKKHRETYSEKQEYYEFCQQPQPPQITWGMFLSLSFAGFVSTVALLNSVYIHQRMFDIHLRLSAASGKIFSLKPW